MMRSVQQLRLVLAICGLVLALAALWLLLAELSRSNVSALPTTKEAAARAATQRGDALVAARIGVLRGELWAELAFTYADLEWARTVDVPASTLSQAKTYATYAVSLMPGNSAVWLLLADLASRYGWQTPNSIEALKMSYYTGPHDDRLIPLRLQVSARIDATADPELQRLFEGELVGILTYRSSLKPAILTAYGQATPPARRTIESTARSLDPAFAQALLANPAR